MIKDLRAVFTPGMRRSNYGRMDGGYIEFEGNVVGGLVDYQPFDMFWDNYSIIPKDDSCREILSHVYLWHGGKFTFRNKRTMELVKSVLSSGPGLPEGRILMRGLYLGK